MSDGTTHVEDEDIVTTWRPDARPSPTATVTDPQDADGTDSGDDADGTDS